MEFAITIAIVAAAGTFVIWRWIRSAKRSLSPSGPGTCGGDCEGCTVPVELLQEPNARPESDANSACNGNPQADSHSPGDR